MTEATDLDRIWHLTEKIGLCMLSTIADGEIVARPMSAHVDRAMNVIYFLTDVTSHKGDEISSSPNVGLAFADASGQKYVSITGRASISNDRTKIRERWALPMKAWWSGPDDPAIRVLKVDPLEAHYWDSPGTLVSTVKMLAAALTHARPVIGKVGSARM